MSKFDFSNLMHGFSMTNPVVLTEMRNGDPVVAYVNAFEGRELAHIRTLYQDRRSGAWCPGNKGISFPVEEMSRVVDALAKRFPLSKSTQRYWRESASQSVMDDYAAGRAKTVQAGQKQEKKTAPVADAKPLAKPSRYTREWLETRDEPTLRNILKYAGLSQDGYKGRLIGRILEAQGEKAVNEPTNAQWRQFMQLTFELSPENLTCDGELSRTQVQRKKAAIEKQWLSLERAVGRNITEDEVLAWGENNTRAAAAALEATVVQPKNGAGLGKAKAWPGIGR